jgi:hypothetical protein
MVRSGVDASVVVDVCFFKGRRFAVGQRADFHRNMTNKPRKASRSRKYNINKINILISI